MVTYCDVRFYKTRGRKRHGNSKAVERWTAPDLQDLRKYRYWRSPDVKAFPVLIATYPKLMNEYIERHGWEGIEVSADAYISLEKDELGNSYFTELVENNDDDYYEGYE